MAGSLFVQSQALGQIRGTGPSFTIAESTAGQAFHILLVLSLPCKQVKFVGSIHLVQTYTHKFMTSWVKIQDIVLGAFKEIHNYINNYIEMI